MGSERKYQLYINNQIVSVLNSLAEAKEEAQNLLKGEPQLRIDCDAAPAKSKIWVYDHKISDWVEQL